MENKEEKEKEEIEVVEKNEAISIEEDCEGFDYKEEE